MIVDDEEAILETMTFTFMDEYDVLTTVDAHEALELIDTNAPVAAVISDQRMPEMSGVELLRKIYERHPDTVRIMLTGFADSENAIKAINDGHVYAYINKPWDQDELKHIVRRAVEHFQLSSENRRLMSDLRRANSIMEAVMDRLDVGAIAIDPSGIIRAANEPARAYLGLEGTLRGRTIDDVLSSRGLDELHVKVKLLCAEQGGFDDHDLRIDGKGHRVRISAQELVEPDGELLGRVILFKEVSHEPLRRSFEEILANLTSEEGSLRPGFEEALDDLSKLDDEVRSSGISSPSMAELCERVSRGRTALQNWLDVDDAMAADDYPDAQLLLDRMRVASQRWPRANELPGRVTALARSVEAYYESGENPRERVL
jgi:FixJ family two-component response regulator